MRRDPITDRVVILLLIYAVALLWSMDSRAAPAPTRKRPQSREHQVIPGECVMVWYKTSYKTTFAPHGFYQAREVKNHSAVYTGSWHIEYGVNNSKTLVIQESCGEVVTEHPTTYRVRMDTSLKRSLDDPIKVEPQR